MSNNNLSIRFTDETYATKSEVSRTLMTSQIGPIWANILAYRKQFAKTLSFFDIAKMPYTLTITANINERLQSVERKYNRFASEYSLLSDNSHEKVTLRREMYMASLRYLAKAKNIEVNDLALKNIIEGKMVDYYYDELVAYFKALLLIERDPNKQIDDSLLAQYLSILLKQNELTSFYRLSEIGTSSQTILINREYDGVPARNIEPMMNNLFDCLRGYETTSVMKTIIILYAFDYIKPFEKYNDDLSLLLIKSVLAKTELGGATAFIPCENLLIERKKELTAALKESQKTRDLTYLLLEVCQLLEQALSIALDRNATLNVETAHSVYVTGNDPVAFEEEFGIPLESVSMVAKHELEESGQDRPNFNSASDDLISKDESVYNHFGDRLSESIIIEHKTEDNSVKSSYEEPITKEPVLNKVEPVQKEENSQKNYQVKKEATPKQERQISVQRTQVVSPIREEAHSNKDFEAMEEDLLESDPNLRPAQAHFYVRHCTIGKYYTIQLYKKCEGVVYETARTSMDNLAKLGYYRRESVKNKFVYTPLKR